MTIDTPRSIRIPVLWGRDGRTHAEGKLVFHRPTGEWTVEAPSEFTPNARLYLNLALDDWGVPGGARAIVRVRAPRLGTTTTYTSLVEFELTSMKLDDLIRRISDASPAADGPEYDSTDDEIVTMDDDEVNDLDAAAQRICDTIPADARDRVATPSFEASLTSKPRALPSVWRRALKYSTVVTVVVIAMLALAYVITWPRIR